MTFALRNSKQLVAGVLFVLIGASAIYLSREYSAGTATNMGPGYFPTLLGIILLGLGCIVIFQGVSQNLRDPVEDLELLPLFFLTSSVIVFGLTVDKIGLVGATFALVILSSYQRLFSKPIEVLIIAAVLSSISVALFVYGIDLGFRIF